MTLEGKQTRRVLLLVVFLNAVNALLCWLLR